MQTIHSHHVQQQLKDSLELLKIIFGTDLLGVYLYGSSIVGGLNNYSDIDLLVVANRKTTSTEKTQLITNFLQISGIYMQSEKPPMEITIVEKSMVNPWQYPPQFDFQYGDWLRKSFEQGIIEPWSTQTMPDLAIIVTQVLLKSQTLWGTDPKKLLVTVPYADFCHAMLDDLPRLTADLFQDTRNVLLTFARIWSTLVTNMIHTKSAAADWALLRLPESYQPVMQHAKSIYLGHEKECWDDFQQFIRPCADFMLDKIKAQSVIMKANKPNSHIKLAE